MAKEALISEGKCIYCDEIVAKRSMSRHLNTHLKKAAEEKPHLNRAFHIRVEMDEYFLNLLVNANLKLEDLDGFLRKIWLECCGHQSSFSIKGKEYGYGWDDDDDGSVGENKSQTMKEVFQAGQKLKYEYDFGSTTELNINVLQEYRMEVKEGIKLLSRNEPLKLLCDSCGTETATNLCSVHEWNEAQFFCKSCAKEHKKQCSDFEYQGLKVVNSPRMGVCAYKCGRIDTQRDGVWQPRISSQPLQDVPPAKTAKEPISLKETTVVKEKTVIKEKIVQKNTEIAKSSLLIQKERELKDLQKKKGQVIKTIKTTKLKIEEIQTDFETSSKEVMNGMTRMVDLSKLGKEVGNLYKDLKKKVKLSKGDKQALNEILSDGILADISDNVDDMFAQTDFGSAENFEAGRGKFEENEFTDEFNRQRSHSMFEGFAVKPDETEQQEIRKIFVSLAGRFHPDKAENETERALFNDLMQSINAAYKRGDLDELLEIKARFSDYKTSDAGTSDYDIPILDVLDEQILKHRSELNLLESQMIRVKTELKNLRDSDIGKSVKSNKDAEKRGQSTTSDFADGTQSLFELLEELKKILLQWLETGKKPLAFNQLEDGSHPFFQKQQGGMDMLSFDDDDSDDMDMSEEEMMEMMAFLSMMEQGDVPKKRKTRRK